MMHSLFNLLRINDRYMFRALLTHPQEVFHKRHLVCYVRVISVGCTKVNRGSAECQLGSTTDGTTTLRHTDHVTTQLYETPLIRFVFQVSEKDL
jgi:hypothetical protein